MQSSLLCQDDNNYKQYRKTTVFPVSIVVSIPACHAGDRGSIPRLGVKLFCFSVTE